MNSLLFFMKLKICIFIPNYIFYTKIINEVIFKTIIGQLGILKNHVPLMTILDISSIIFRRKLGWITAILFGGIRCIQIHLITVLVNSAEIAYLMKLNEIKKKLKIETNYLN